MPFILDLWTQKKNTSFALYQEKLRLHHHSLIKYYNTPHNVIELFPILTAREGQGAGVSNVPASWASLAPGGHTAVQYLS